MILESATRRNNSAAKMIQVYGDAVEGSFSEDDPLKPSSPYASTKSAADMFVLSHYRICGLDVAVESEVGWSPSYSFAEALKKTTKWYINNESWWKLQASKKMLDPAPWKLIW